MKLARFTTKDVTAISVASGDCVIALTRILLGAQHRFRAILPAGPSLRVRIASAQPRTAGFSFGSNSKSFVQRTLPLQLRSFGLVTNPVLNLHV